MPAMTHGIVSKPKTVAISSLNAPPLKRALSDCRDAADCGRGRGGIRFDRLSGRLGDRLDAGGDPGGTARAGREEPAASPPALLPGPPGAFAPRGDGGGACREPQPAPARGRSGV